MHRVVAVAYSCRVEDKDFPQGLPVTCCLLIQLTLYIIGVRLFWNDALGSFNHPEMGAFRLTCFPFRFSYWLRHLPLSVLSRVMTFVFLLEMKLPVCIKITTRPQRPQAQDGFSFL